MILVFIVNHDRLPCTDIRIKPILTPSLDHDDLVIIEEVLKMSFTRGRRFAPFESPSWSLVVKPESKSNRKTRQFFAATVDMTRLEKLKSPEVNLKLYHKKVYELCLAATLFLLITMTQLARQSPLLPATMAEVDINIEVKDIPVTVQIRRPQPPSRPAIPVPTEEESIPADVTIASTEFDLTYIPLPPPPPEDDELPVFFEYDEEPKIIGGKAELEKHLEYPQLARREGVEGNVYLRVIVGLDGKTEKVEVIKAEPANWGFEESAVAAIQLVRWKPARQRDAKIRVWVTIPVQFRLFGN